MGQAAGREGARPRGTCARAGERAAWAGGPETLCAPEPAPGRGGRGARAPPARSAWAFVCHRVGSSPWCGVAPHWPAGVPLPRQVPALPGDGVEPGRGAGWRARRGRAGRARQERRPSRHVPPAGRAARRGRGTWRPLRAARSRLFPAQASGRVRRARRTDPLPLGAPVGARAGHKGRPACPEPRSARASPPLVAQPPRSGRGEDSARPALTCRPLAAARGPAWPPCATCAAAGLGSMSVAGTWQCGVFTPVRFSLDKLVRRGKNHRGERTGDFCGTGRGGN